MIWPLWVLETIFFSFVVLSQLQYFTLLLWMSNDEQVADMTQSSLSRPEKTKAEGFNPATVPDPADLQITVLPVNYIGQGEYTATLIPSEFEVIESDKKWYRSHHFIICTDAIKKQAGHFFCVFGPHILLSWQSLPPTSSTMQLHCWFGRGMLVVSDITGLKQKWGAVY